MMKKYVILIMLIGFGISGFAQQTYYSSGHKSSKRKAKPKGFQKENLIYGGGATLGFGNSYYGSVFSAGVFPLFGYRFNDYLSAGVSLGYTYQSFPDGQLVPNYSTGQNEKYPLRFNYLRGGIWGRLSPFQSVPFLNSIFAHTELERNYATTKIYDWDAMQNKIVGNRVSQGATSLLVGPGYKMQMGYRVSLVYLLLWDVFQNASFNQIDDGSGQTISKSPYWRTQEFRIGINIGF